MYIPAYKCFDNHIYTHSCAGPFFVNFIGFRSLEGVMRVEKAPKFICDEMLKKLARWLRILGFDTTDPSVKDDRELVCLSKNENRIILTRDKDLSNMKNAETLRVISDDLNEQLEQVFERFPPEKYPLQNTRCPSCNGELRSQWVRNGGGFNDQAFDVPADVIRMHDRIFICNECTKVYWTGSHWDRIIERLRILNITPHLPQ